MDPAIIGYSKQINLSLHDLNDEEFREIFIGANKENQDLQNNTPKNNTFDCNHQSQNELTPLNTDTKLSISAKGNLSKTNGTHLYALPKQKLNIYSAKGLPPLPNTPSPPRMVRQRVHSQKNRKYSQFVEPLNESRNYTNYAHYDNSEYYPRQNHSESYNDFEYDRNGYYYGYNEQEWYHKNGKFQSRKNNSNYYYSNPKTFAQSNTNPQTKRDSYFAQTKAPRFQRDLTVNSTSANVCKYWSKGAVCLHGMQCQFSHENQCDYSRKRVTNYKTKPCVDPGRGLKCEYCDRCNFAHPSEALRRPMPIEYTDNQYFKLLLRDCPTNRYPFGIFV